MEGLKKWNWSLFFVFLCASLIASMGFTFLPYFFDRVMLGLVIGLMLGFLIAYFTKDK